MDWAGLARLVLERSVFVATCVILVFGLVWLGSKVGLTVPDQILPWLNLIVFVALAIIITEAIWKISAFVRYQMREAASSREEAEDALKNLAALYPAERKTLFALLGSNAPRRFTVGPLSPIYPLLEKGIVIRVRDAGGTDWICELHPTIWDNRDDIRSAIHASEKPDEGGVWAGGL